jgi:HSP20 family protein
MFYVRNKNYGLGNLRGSLFDEIFNAPFKEETNLMKTDVKEEENSYVFDIDIPGFEKEDIKLSLEDGYLSVEARKEEVKEDASDEKNPKLNYISRERYYGSYSRTYYVGEVQEDNISANYKNGILTINIPKQIEKVETKKYISIE